jgi:transposase
MANKIYKPEFKAKVALEALKNTKSAVELSAEFKTPKTNITEWKSKLLEQMSSIFEGDSVIKKQIKLMEKDIDKLHSMIGQLTIENQFYKKKYLKLQHQK